MCEFDVQSQISFFRYLVLYTIHEIMSFNDLIHPWLNQWLSFSVSIESRSLRHRYILLRQHAKHSLKQILFFSCAVDQYIWVRRIVWEVSIFPLWLRPILLD